MEFNMNKTHATFFEVFFLGRHKKMTFKGHSDWTDRNAVTVLHSA